MRRKSLTPADRCGHIKSRSTVAEYIHQQFSSPNKQSNSKLSTEIKYIRHISINMSPQKRGFFSRLGFQNNGDLRSAVKQFDLYTSARDDYSPRNSTILPPYSLYADLANRSPSPAPSYYTVDEPCSPTFRPIFPETRNEIAVHTQAAIDEMVNRLRESLKNSKAWRHHKNGERSFFWALPCAPGTADLLYKYVAEIRDRVLNTQDWRIEKFCFIFKGQKLGDFFCRPVHEDVNFLSIYKI